MTNRAFLIGAAALIFGVAAIAAGARDEERMPDFDGTVAWLNSAPLSSKSLRGKVVLVNFWTYSCINSLRELPYMQAWAAKYVTVQVLRSILLDKSSGIGYRMVDERAASRPGVERFGT
jgi:thiol-disulfide isomerase/thioredoxin